MISYDKILVCFHVTFKFCFFASAVRSSRSFIVPNIGSTSSKSDISYPKSTIGLRLIGDNHIAVIPDSVKCESLSLIPAKKRVKIIS